MRQLPTPSRSPSDISPVLWDEEGQPRSRLFGDIYYSNLDGLAESRAVFLEGCGLPEAWRGRARFSVGELGFGSGLNLLALAQLWLATREPGARLKVFSVEAFPMPAQDAARALAAWPELGGLAQVLLARWPRRAPGFQRLDFDDWGLTLDLAVMDVDAALAAWSGFADAWFLDGFSPACNPAMWSCEVMAAVARRSAPGARAATFTVAGAVRRGLEAAGFTVDKRPGFGRKRERLEARLGGASQPRDIPSVAVIGAGVAGAALVRALRAAGAQVAVVEALEPGAGASGNPAALSSPRLDAGGGAVARLYAQAAARAADLYEAIPGAVIDRGALQLEAGPKDAGRFDRIARDGPFEAGAVVRLTAEEAGARLGEPTQLSGLWLREARVVEPAAVLQAWLAGVERRCGAAARLEPCAEGWRILDVDGAELARAGVVCLANGLDAARLFPQLLLAPVRGQASWSHGVGQAGPPALWGGYAIPMRDGLLFGATHDRDEVSIEVREADHARNLALLAEGRPALARTIAPEGLEGRAGVRAVSPDFLPLAGQVPAAADSGRIAGLYVLSGLGSRGFCAAPLLAEHVAALAVGAPSPLPADLAQLVDPSRFRARLLRRRGEKAPLDG